jgi:membrane associated rhomboid family serine protease
MNPTRVWTFLPRGLREPLALFLITGIIVLVGSYSGAYNLYRLFAFWPGDFLHGRVWQALTYPLLPGGLPYLIWNLFFFAVLAARLVRAFGRQQFWLFCFVATLGTAAVKLALTPVDQGPLIGIGGIVFAMFAAWHRLFSNEDVMLMSEWRMKMGPAILITAGLNIMFSLLSSCGFWNAVAILGGWATGWLYLAAQERWRMRGGAKQLPTERISRLEI